MEWLRQGASFSMYALLAIWPPLAMATGSVSMSYFWPWFLVKVCLWIAAVIFLVDVRGRFRDYMIWRRRIKRDQSVRRGVRIQRNTWCGRTVLAWAATSVSKEYGREVRDEYHRMGYRWWHLTPDKAFTLDSPFLTVGFWKQLIFDRARPN